MYWPFLPAAGLTPSGELGATLAADIQLAVDAMFTTQTYTVGASSITTVPVILKSGRLPHAAVITDVNVFFATGKLGTIKARGDYGKPNLPI